MDFAYNVGDEVTLLQGNNCEERQVYWASAMDKLVGQKGIITGRTFNAHLGKPVYSVDFGDDGWWCEEYWLELANYISDTVSDEDASAINDFMKEW